jgi:signal transduction histidine kinase
MRFNFSTRIFSWYYYIIITAILIIGALASVFTYLKISESTQKALLKNAATIGSIFDTSNILSFRGDAGDLKNPGYLSLKNKLEKIPEINSEIRFVYLWGYRDQNVYFFIDSEPATSPDYSPPGQVYGEATEIDYNMFLKNLPSTMEMSTDRWGTWLSALTPIKDPSTGKLIAVMGVDMSANTYFRTIYVYTAIPVLSTIFVLILIVVGFILRKREQEFLTFKSELVAIASHEIRSPLTGITWIMDALLREPEGMSEKQKYDIDLVKNKSEELLLTVNDLLDGAVAEKLSKKRLSKQSIQVKALFEEIRNNSFLVLAEKNIKLNIDSSVAPELTILGDLDRIKRMFNNLLSNAIKYSKSGGSVKVSAINEEANLIFSIKDEGIGISPKDQNKIFRGFFRSENAKKITSNGTGLGLHYVKQIAELHNGKVWCESKEGIGSTFYVKLPKA